MYDILFSEDDDDCLSNLLVSDYRGTVSVTNHGFTCQHWIAQTPHRHDKFVNNPELAYENYNYCRKIDDDRPWCITTDPYIVIEFCTYTICNGKILKDKSSAWSSVVLLSLTHGKS